MKALLVCLLALIPSIPPACAEDAPSFSLTINAAHDTTQVGAESSIEVALKNTSDRDQAVALAQGAPEVTFDIRAFDSDGKETLRTAAHRAVRSDNGSFGWGGGSTIISTLKPGKVLRQHVVLNKVFDLSRPGKYTIVARFMDTLGSKTIIRSNTIVVAITP